MRDRRHKDGSAGSGIAWDRKIATGVRMHTRLYGYPALLYIRNSVEREKTKKGTPMNLKSNSFLPSPFQRIPLDSSRVYLERVCIVYSQPPPPPDPNLNIYTIRKLRLASWRFNSWRTLTSTRSLAKVACSPVGIE